MQDAISFLLVSLVLMGSASPCFAADEPLTTNARDTGGEVRGTMGAEIIKSIEFEGNRKFQDHVLRDRLGFELGDRLDRFLAEGGRLTISEVYRKIGYPFVKVSLDQTRLLIGHLLYRIDEGPRAEVGSVRFVGNKTFNSWTLEQIVKKTKRREWFFWPPPFTEEDVDEDLNSLREFYYDKGFLDHEIKAETKFTADQKKVRVTFFIEEGPVYRMSKIGFSGHAQFTDEQLRAMIELNEGDVYLRPSAERDARKLVQFYRERGYVDAEVRQIPNFAPQEENLVAVEFEVREGRQFRIGRIEITGNDLTKEKVVRRILDEYDFTPGELYNAKVAPKQGGGLLEEYVQRGAVAEEVMIRPVDPPAEEITAPPGVPPVEEPNRKDVRIDLKEGMTGLIMPGVGFSSNDGVIGRLLYRQYNFDIGDWPEDVNDLFSMRALRGAGQTLNVILEPGTRYSQYSVSFVDPYWQDKPVKLAVLGRKWERFRESYDEERLKGQIDFESRLKNRWRPNLGFRAENVGVDDLDFDAPQEIRDVEGNTQLIGMRVGLGKVDVDNLYDPTEGSRMDTYYEQVTGDDAFGILEASYVHFFPLYEDVLGRATVLATKVVGGVMVGDAPPFEKFYGGGTHTSRYGIRGFEYRGVSTRGLQTNVDPALTERKDPIGSDWIFLASAEITVPLIGENFGLLFFTDSGTVDTGSYRMSIGTGIEIKVPQIFGNVPMRFELATPLLRDDDDDTQVFSFSGGSFLY